MAVAFGCSLGGMNTLIGTPVNLVARTTVDEAGLGSIGFFEFAKFGIPMNIVAVLFMYFIGYKILPGVPIDLESLRFREDASVMSPRKQWTVLGVFLLVVLGMSLESILGIPVYIIAFIGVALLFFTRTITDRQAYSYIEWPAVFIVAGILPLAGAMTKTGAADLIADKVIGLVGPGASVHVFIAALFLLVCFLTQIMSNTACAALLLPVGVSLANGLGCDPMAVIFTISIAAQCSLATPLATPHNTYIMGIAGYKFSDFLKAGLPLCLIAFLLSICLIPLIWAF